MENKNITAKEANEAWLKAIKAKFERESETLFSRSPATESDSYMRPVKVETRRRANGRTFSVAIYANGTTSDLD